MTDQVTLLHSQLLFERNQCLQHAARNRRLLREMHKSCAETEDFLTMVNIIVVVIADIVCLCCSKIKYILWSKQ